MNSRLLYIWMGMWGLLLLASCSGDLDAVAPSSIDKTKINFVLSMGRSERTRTLLMGEESKVSVESEEEAGNEYDRAINIGEIHVFLCDLSNVVLEEVKPLMVTPSVDGSYYHIEGQISKEYRTFKVVVYANCGNDPLSNSSCTLPVRFDPLKPLTYMPMWGVETVTNMDWTTSRKDLGTISLLRAMAKVEVMLDPSIQNAVALTGCSFVNGGTEVKFRPHNDEAIESTKAYFRTMSTLKGAVGETTSIFNHSLPFAVENKETKSYAIYVPECSSAKKPSISVSLREEPANGVTRTASIYFKDYSAYPGDNPTYNYMWDVTRDFHYRFIIKKVKFSSVDVSFEVEIEGYGIIDQYPDYE